ncbi:hypothetical protein [Kyrpidia tusciae]|uniref:Uncharacterized protein n=1 Tax=Kyrpidia tusciae (strain DSM 2912 / NBRC 15312 / T2) TaxID=562970 RepID=D5WT35_KYRT2|nr:hypothetical protein [Kyrpidia tusciae]ADG05139.1 hypothetical protein Btus_0368 [Kyrpidia tusciae DSM 2912]
MADVSGMSNSYVHDRIPFDSCMNQNPLNDKPRKEDDHLHSLARAFSG